MGTSVQRKALKIISQLLLEFYYTLLIEEENLLLMIVWLKLWNSRVKIYMSITQEPNIFTQFSGYLTYQNYQWIPYSTTEIQCLVEIHVNSALPAS